MNNCKHKFKYIESSEPILFINNKKLKYDIDKYQCIKCNKWYFVDKKTQKRIYLNNILGDEAE